MGFFSVFTKIARPLMSIGKKIGRGIASIGQKAYRFFRGEKPAEKVVEEFTGRMPVMPSTERSVVDVAREQGRIHPLKEGVRDIREKPLFKGEKFKLPPKASKRLRVSEAKKILQTHKLTPVGLFPPLHIPDLPGTILRKWVKQPAVSGTIEEIPTGAFGVDRDIVRNIRGALDRDIARNIVSVIN